MSASHTQFAAPERRVFVTGGSGFLGCRVITQLVGEGYAVQAARVAVPRSDDRSRS